uniref:Reverse transcriptase domain-containing protein n=1 Tax=Leptobrachium leishanense TaxID=445787 RepID=A0A8C5M1L9_9ANUR
MLRREKQAKMRGLEVKELECLETLIQLLNENEIPEKGPPYSNLKSKTTFTPSIKEYDNLELFRKLVCQDIENLGANPETGLVEDNLTTRERKALKELTMNTDLIIKPSDKGGNITIMSKDQYECMVKTLLDDNKVYVKLPQDPTKRFMGQLGEILIHGYEKGHISEEEYRFLKTDKPVIATFYALPKVHKNLEKPPGRPIVSGIGNLTQNCSQYIDQILQNLVKTLPSYLRDTKQLLQIMNNFTFPKEAWLCSLDVEALYSSIPHMEGLLHMKLALQESGEFTEEFITFIEELLAFILKHNYFIFDRKFYHQIQGTAMGTTCAPTYANIYLGVWEKQYVFSDQNPFRHKILLWKRYIDDIFLIWGGTPEDFLDLTNYLNRNSLNLRFTYEIHQNSLNFLDVTIVRNEERVSTTLYRKETATNSLLNWTSFHPKPLRLGIPYGQYLRLKRICSSNIEYEKQAKILQKNFKEKGYPNRVLKQAYQKAAYHSRDTLLQDTPKNDSNRIRCIGNYDTGNNTVKNIMDRYWPLLTLDPHLKESVGPRATITNRRCKNLKDLLVHSHYEKTKLETTSWLRNNLKGTYSCGRCKSCANILKDSKVIHDTRQEKTFLIHNFFNCNTSGLVYMITCGCGKKYVGKTFRPFKYRIREHIRSIGGHIDTPVARHVRQCQIGNINNLKFCGIELVKHPQRGGNYDLILRRRECFWIYTLHTLAPEGLNEGFTFTPFI